eukprot:6184900-Pleurochrysis_carterae.AAC.7
MQRLTKFALAPPKRGANLHTGCGGALPPALLLRAARAAAATRRRQVAVPNVATAPTHVVSTYHPAPSLYRPRSAQ